MLTVLRSSCKATRKVSRSDNPSRVIVADQIPTISVADWIPTLETLGVETRDPAGGETWGAYVAMSAIDPTVIQSLLYSRPSRC